MGECMYKVMFCPVGRQTGLILLGKESNGECRPLEKGDLGRIYE